MRSLEARAMDMYFTEHARTRMQQRGIPSAAVDLLIDYGKSAPAGDGCELVFFDKGSGKQLAMRCLSSRLLASRL
jgi:hypothetical protein